MSIPYHDYLSLNTYRSNPCWYKSLTAQESNNNTSPAKQAVTEVLTTAFKEPIVRGVQLIRDMARLIFKVPIRAIRTPVILEKNWRERERAGVNAKLAGYAIIQLFSLPGKFIVALAALAASSLSENHTKSLLGLNKKWTAYFDGRASQLEALKEEGAKQAQDKKEFNEYKAWLYGIDPQFCRNIRKEG